MLDGKRVIVTGAAQGIGAALGAKVVRRLRRQDHGARDLQSSSRHTLP